MFLSQLVDFQLSTRRYIPEIRALLTTVHFIIVDTSICLSVQATQHNLQNLLRPADIQLNKIPVVGEAKGSLS
jgi:hypothetical protein